MSKPKVYITQTGSFLPNAPVSNEEIEEKLGKIHGIASTWKKKILAKNGIQTRHYALNKNGETTHLNEELAANAISSCLTYKKNVDVDFLSTATTQGDLPVPGFAAMVQARAKLPACEIASYHGVCASSIAAAKGAYLQIAMEEHKTALCVASELSSRLFKASKFQNQNGHSLDFDSEFLRWMLSDGAGALLLQNKKNEVGLSLEIEWIKLKSFANQYPLCMYTGKENATRADSWQDYSTIEEAAIKGCLNLKQDVRLVKNIVNVGFKQYCHLIDEGIIIPEKVDHFCCHYSSMAFKESILSRMKKKNLLIDENKWFSNLTYKGNTGAASIFIMLDELFKSNKLKKGETILCMVPESARFTAAFMQLKVT